ncbi:MAG: uroporphyrinogen-III synthase [Gammaproteobacteria bacterium]|nr:uroporphyrinogen-III synthase [Gammaproteobacteria bacterium]MCP4980683.1 uroporphyrinogen-III synthase [Gammaproteobacteria bacterium]
MPASLQGQVILNTRPAHQQAELSDLLERQGARVVSFPLIEIVPVEAGDLQRRMVREIKSYDFLLFVSRNAVDGAFRFIDTAQLSTDTSFGVIGTATRLALAERVGALESCLLGSEPYNSESLLDADELQRVEGKRILIFRGQEGRNLLGDELAVRGALIDYCEVYRRALPQRDITDFNRMTADAFPGLAILTSNAGMQNLFELVDSQAATALRRTPWLLISERMRESASKLGHNAPIIIARSASDKGILQTICEWADQR